MTSLNDQMTSVTTPLLGHYESPLPPLYEPPPQGPPKPRLMFKMPRVVPDQKTKFESDELFRRLARETEVSTHTRTHTHIHTYVHTHARTHNVHTHTHTHTQSKKNPRVNAL